MERSFGWWFVNRMSGIDVVYSMSGQHMAMMQFLQFNAMAMMSTVLLYGL